MLTKSSPRADAEALLRSADRIFIAYSSGDLAVVRDLRRRILRLRPGRSADTVFMASDSLSVAQPVEPGHIREALANADLFVVGCGRTTAGSPWVVEEVQQALAQRAAGKTSILPIILQAKVTLPAGIDFAIQAIHRVTLFPAIRRVQVVAIAAVAVLVLTAAGTGVVALNRTRQRDLVALQGQLQMNALQPTEAVDLVRRSWLETQRREAVRLKAQSEIESIDRDLQRYATESMRRLWLDATPGRRFLVVDPGRPVVWIGYDDHIEARRVADATVLRDFSLKRIEAVPFEPPPALGDDNGRKSVGVARSPARLAALRSDPRVVGVLAEVEYPDGFAELGKKESFERLGYDSTGGEREVFQLVSDSATMQTLGVSLELTAQNDATGDLGTYDTLVSHAAAIEAQLSQPTARQRRLAFDDWASGDSVIRIATNPRTGDSVFHVIKDMKSRDDGSSPFSFTGWRDHWAVSLSVGGKAINVAEAVQVFPAGTRMAWPDGDLDGRNPFVAAPPRYEPAALDEAGALLRPTVQWSPATKNPSEVRALWLSAGGRLRLFLADGSLATAARDGTDIHRFPRPGQVLAADISPDGREVLVLNLDGRVDAWALPRFGEDGWVASTQAVAANVPPAAP